eukprot:5717307-Heterocapsa_arctica.AAC.1
MWDGLPQRKQRYLSEAILAQATLAQNRLKYSNRMHGLLTPLDSHLDDGIQQKESLRRSPGHGPEGR